MPRNYCYVVIDKQTKEEHLIPECYECSMYTGVFTAREIIKEYCTCQRPTKDKFKMDGEVKDRDGILSKIRDMEANYEKQKTELESFKFELEVLKDAFFIEVIETDL